MAGHQPAPIIPPPPPIAAAANGGGVPPPVVPGMVGVAEPPRMPFPADPGTITAWLVTETASQSEEELIRELSNAEAIYDKVDGNNTDFRTIARQVLSTEELLCFLTVRMTEKGTKVSLVHSLGRYSKGFILTALTNYIRY